MAGRFIKLYDKILSWEWYKNINVKVLFLHLLLRANYKDMRFEGHLIKRGQLVTSLPSLQAETGLSVMQIRSSLEKLTLTGEITASTFPRYRVITIVHYEEYQDNNSLDNSQVTGKLTAKQQANNRQVTGNQQASNSQITASIEYIEQKEGIEKVEPIESVSAKRKDRTSSDFEMFWSAYPRHEDKQAAKKAFDKIRPDEQLLQTMLTSIAAWKESDQWNEDGGKYIPYPSSWLNKRRWEDEVPAKKAKAPEKPAPVRSVAAQQYEQRDYSEREETMEEVLMRLQREGYC